MRSKTLGAAVVGAITLAALIPAGAVAAGMITGADIKNGTVTNFDLKDNNVTTNDVRDASLRRRDLNSSVFRGLGNSTPTTLHEWVVRTPGKTVTGPTDYQPTRTESEVTLPVGTSLSGLQLAVTPDSQCPEFRVDVRIDGDGGGTIANFSTFRGREVRSFGNPTVTQVARKLVVFTSCEEFMESRSAPAADVRVHFQLTAPAPGPAAAFN